MKATSRFVLTRRAFLKMAGTSFFAPIKLRLPSGKYLLYTPDRATNWPFPVETSLEEHVQSPYLRMTGIGIVNDEQERPNKEQPPLVDGIHLRWAFTRDRGFPPYGFYLFRRIHQEGDLLYLSDFLDTLSETTPNLFTMNDELIVGSDSPLVLTDLDPSFEAQPHSGNKGFLLGRRRLLDLTLHPNSVARRIELSLGFLTSGSFEIYILSNLDQELIATTTIYGDSGESIPIALEFDSISTIRLVVPEIYSSTDLAVLIDFGYVPVASDTQGWKTIPSFPYRLALPVFHPDYPAGKDEENLEAARQRASERILYDDPNKLIVITGVVYDAGTVSLERGNPVIVGHSTEWSENLIGAVLRVEGDQTAYTVMVVLAPDRLMISRAYAGDSKSYVSYSISEDKFAKLHDLLVHLVAQGSVPLIPMYRRFLPVPIHRSKGTLSVGKGSDQAEWLGSDWRQDLLNVDITGLALQIVHDSIGYVGVTKNDLEVRGTNTDWDASLVGMTFQVIGYPSSYTIRKVDKPRQMLTLSEERHYEGPTGDEYDFVISEPDTYTIQAVRNVGPDRRILTLDRPYRRGDGDAKSFILSCPQVSGQSLQSARSAVVQYPLDSLLLESLVPSVAQMLGLYWVDQAAEDNITYDYLIIAAHQRDLLNEVTTAGGEDLKDNVGDIWQVFEGGGADGYITYNQRKFPSSLTSPPGVVYCTAYELPSAYVSQERNAHNSAGLKWNARVFQNNDLGWFQKSREVMYHIWRYDYGTEEPAEEIPVDRYTCITRGRPVLVTNPKIAAGKKPHRVKGWPPFPLNYIDGKLPDGWYGYRACSVDIFGRYSPLSFPAWGYFDDPASGKATPLTMPHSFAVHLVDLAPPPAPTGVEAYTLDPQDPTLLKDAPYLQWRETVEPNLIGLRVSWLWSPAHMRQAPDTREFRIYFSSGLMNAIAGRITSVAAIGENQYDVQTDIANTLPANTYVGAWLRVGLTSFEIVTSEAVTSLRIRVKRGDKDKAPLPNAPCALVLPPAYRAGTVSVTHKSDWVYGQGTDWTTQKAKFVGWRFRIPGESQVYVVKEILSATSLRLDRNYELEKGLYRYPYEDGSTTQSYSIEHPLWVDYSNSLSWDNRMFVVDADQNYSEMVMPARSASGDNLVGEQVTVLGNTVRLDDGPDLSGIPIVADSPFAPFLFLKEDSYQKVYRIAAVDNAAKTISIDGIPDLGAKASPWMIGPRVRRYEVFLPAPQQGFDPDEWQPIVFAHIGVSAADNQDIVPDKPKWSAGQWGQRSGNEGPVGQPAKIFRVKRTRPTAPKLPSDVEKVFATPADYHSHSYYTYRWQPTPPLKVHVFRALDDAVFQVDWNYRKKKYPEIFPIDAAEMDYFPEEFHADALRRGVIAAEINKLNDFLPNDNQEAMAHYRSMRNDSLRVLAGLPWVAQAFTQITLQPLDPEDPRWTNRPGPDNPDGFYIDKSLRIYIDELDGKATNRYFYRAAYIDGAHNRSPLSLSSPPVWLPNVVPPRAPSITKITAGDREITLSWATNREPDLAEYRIYRTDDPNAAREIRLMELVQTIAVEPGDPSARPQTLSWTDKPVPGSRDLWYRIVAVDRVDADPKNWGGNVSDPSPAIRTRAYELTPPEPPLITTLEWVHVDTAGGMHAWTERVTAGAYWESAVHLVWVPAAADIKLLVQVKGDSDADFTAASSWLEPGTTMYLHRTTRTFEAHQYRLKVVSRAGNTNVIYHPLALPPPV